MNVRQKFFALSGVAGVIMAVVAVVGYFTAANSLRSAVEQEIVSEIGRQSAQVDGWWRKENTRRVSRRSSRK